MNIEINKYLNGNRILVNTSSVRYNIVVNENNDVEIHPITTSHGDNNDDIELNDLNASNIKQHRQKAHQVLKEQAKKMNIPSNKKKFLLATPGHTVKVKLPEID